MHILVINVDRGKCPGACHAGGGDCELRGSGPTPLAGSLLAMEDYVGPIRDTDPAAACRGYSVILVTDGLDKDSYYKFAEVVEHLKEIDVQIYLVGFTGDLDKDSGLFRKSEKGKAEALLTKLAEDTGGIAFFPRELAEVHTIASQISTELRTQYSIGYYPTNEKKDGTFPGAGRVGL